MSYPKNVLQLAQDEHRRVCINARWDPDKRTREQTDVLQTVSFVYIDGHFAAEWETIYGPISIVRCADLPAGQQPASRDKAKDGDIVRHHIFPHVYHEFGRCNQSAVDQRGLPQAYVDGRYDYIWHVLRDFVEWAQEADG